MPDEILENTKQLTPTVRFLQNQARSGFPRFIAPAINRSIGLARLKVTSAHRSSQANRASPNQALSFKKVRHAYYYTPKIRKLLGSSLYGLEKNAWSMNYQNGGLDQFENNEFGEVLHEYSILKWRFRALTAVMLRKLDGKNRARNEQEQSHVLRMKHANVRRGR